MPPSGVSGEAVVAWHRGSLQGLWDQFDDRAVQRGLEPKRQPHEDGVRVRKLRRGLRRPRKGKHAHWSLLAALDQSDPKAPIPAVWSHPQIHSRGDLTPLGGRAVRDDGGTRRRRTRIVDHTPDQKGRRGRGRTRTDVRAGGDRPRSDRNQYRMKPRLPSRSGARPTSLGRPLSPSDTAPPGGSSRVPAFDPSARCIQS
jgi:hypothetical protein